MKKNAPMQDRIKSMFILIIKVNVSICHLEVNMESSQQNRTLWRQNDVYSNYHSCHLAGMTSVVEMLHIRNFLHQSHILHYACIVKCRIESAANGCTSNLSAVWSPEGGGSAAYMAGWSGPCNSITRKPTRIIGHKGAAHFRGPVVAQKNARGRLGRRPGGSKRVDTGYDGLQRLTRSTCIVSSL